MGSRKAIALHWTPTVYITHRICNQLEEYNQIEGVRDERHCECEVSEESAEASGTWRLLGCPGEVFKDVYEVATFWKVIDTGNGEELTEEARNT